MTPDVLTTSSPGSQLEKELDGKLRHVYNLINVKGRRRITSEMLMEYLKGINVQISSEHSDRFCELISPQEKQEFTESEFIRFLMPIAQASAVTQGRH